MLVVVSPAKRLNEGAAHLPPRTRPEFQDAADDLARIAGHLTGPELEKLMHISPNLGKLNADRFQNFASGQGAKSALDLFSGDTYAGLEAATLDTDALTYAQDHLRILSGLYGLLRPLDEIMPHRLEMGTRLATERGCGLYEYWGDRIARSLNRQARNMGSDVVLNCASVEYFKAVDKAALQPRIVTPVFYEARESGPKIVSFFAKKARGAMARFVMETRLTDPGGLKDFTSGGYRFQAHESTQSRLVFLRDTPAA
ncbi:MAG TPA: peroxide stress protein YaaA [Aliiroseovarius sp.]|nr:peroxide stress protein YaaA [Aliiroseovarius sp.]